MFRVRKAASDTTLRIAVVAVLTLSVAALVVTVWVMVDFLAEQQIVHELIGELPAEVKSKAEDLEGELRWQFRLSTLIVLNLVVTGFALVLLSRAYRSSQASLRDFKALASDILSGLDQAVITTDQLAIVTSINQRGLEMLEPESECVGLPLAELSRSVPLEQFRQDWLQDKSLAMTRDFKTSYGGSDRVLRGFCQTLHDVNDREIGFILQLRDVTRRVLIEDRMRRMERYMGLGALAAGLHHEIKNPLAALALHVQLLEEQLEQGNADDDVAQMLDVIKTEVARVGGVLEGFRDFALIGKLNVCPIVVRDLVQRQIDLITPQATERSVRIETRWSPSLPPAISADPVRLEQVLLNVLLNAIEAMPDGGEVLVAVDDDADSVIIEISDTGSGVPDDLRDKIFDPYFTTKCDGTGLGLALCDKIMRQHNGSLDFSSSPKGTTFQLMLPKVTPQITESRI